MKYMLDTNICIYALKGGDTTLDARIRGCESGDLVMSMITRAELEVGFEQAEDPVAAREDFVEFFNDVPAAPFGDGAAAAFGMAQARSPAPKRSFDRLIAAHALSLGLTLVTNNERDFRGVPGLKLENWTKSAGPARGPS